MNRYERLSLWLAITEEICSDEQFMQNIIEVIETMRENKPREGVQFVEPLILEFLKKALEKRRLMT